MWRADQLKFIDMTCTVRPFAVRLVPATGLVRSGRRSAAGSLLMGDLELSSRVCGPDGTIRDGIGMSGSGHHPRTDPGDEAAGFDSQLQYGMWSGYGGQVSPSREVTRS